MTFRFPALGYIKNITTAFRKKLSTQYLFDSFDEPQKNTLNIITTHFLFLLLKKITWGQIPYKRPKSLRHVSEFSEIYRRLFFLFLYFLKSNSDQKAVEIILPAPAK